MNRCNQCDSKILNPRRKLFCSINCCNKYHWQKSYLAEQQRRYSLDALTDEQFFNIVVRPILTDLR